MPVTVGDTRTKHMLLLTYEFNRDFPDYHWEAVKAEVALIGLIMHKYEPNFAFPTKILGIQ